LCHELKTLFAACDHANAFVGDLVGIDATEMTVGQEHACRVTRREKEQQESNQRPHNRRTLRRRQNFSTDG
jgi:hypothetical protein